MNIEKEENELTIALDYFYSLMKSKLLNKLDLGYAGWKEGPETLIKKRLFKNLAEEDYLDVANLSMMLYLLRERKE